MSDLEKQLAHYEGTLKAIADSYSHTKQGNEADCSCAACVADRAVRTWNPE